mgnify:FL=1
MTNKSKIEELNSEINKLTIEIDNMKKMLLVRSGTIGFDGSIIEKELISLETKIWKLNNELRTFITYKTLEPNENSINNPSNYTFHKSSIKCKLCNSEGDDVYVFHTLECRFKHQFTCVKYILGIM